METDETESKAPQWRRALRLILSLFGGGILLVGVLVGATVLRWNESTVPATPEAFAALESDDAVSVEQNRWIVFSPQGEQPQTGLIFYPGGRVDERSYAPPMRALAEEGYLTVIVPMPLDLAILGMGRAEAVMAAYPEIEQWAIGGHSMGAASAASYTFNAPNAVDGVVLWAGFPPRDQRLTGFDHPITVVTASEDGFVHERRVQWFSDRVPAGATFVEIEGGNHAQFGYYVVEPGGRDGTPTISIEEQQQQAVEATLALLEAINGSSTAEETQ